ncbi:multiple organellar RNA editing factor 8, chloroplastic/mitochondrial-like isoform X2 [Lotus japonicus]|uniref:multiple organellar RNA editing factor 8, chloroplastic/mitochondrial-like isoform X2 n=1 Tax=Lotus japonicus TaxID=34305 RepID=UPI002583E200|nr:multiple organellar RNA editing factor 8, chloroplastic/mitochondrial-like isoform X2 [Lotus japonicus]
MATQIFSRVLPKTRTLNLAPFFTRSLSTSTTTTTPSLSALSFLRRYRPLSAVSIPTCRHLFPSARSLSTRATTSSLNDPNPNWSNRPPKETILLDGCDFEHWLVVMEKPEGDPTRDDIIDGYIKTLAQVVGSEQEARMKIYSVSTKHYFAFGALVSEELSYKLKELPKVRWVLPDSYLNVREKDYGGEPFINGEAVPYDPKYHEEWVRNNARANERNRRNDRPRNNDRSRNFDRRRENVVNRDYQNRPPPNAGGPPSNQGGFPPNNAGGPPSNQGGFPPNNAGGYPASPRPGNMPGPPPSNPGGYPPNNQAGGYHPQNQAGGYPPNSQAGGYPPNSQAGGYPPNSQAGYPSNQNNYAGNMEGVPPNQNVGGYSPNAGWSNNAPTRDTPSRDFGAAVGGNTYNG